MKAYFIILLSVLSLVGCLENNDSSESDTPKNSAVLNETPELEEASPDFQNEVDPVVDGSSDDFESDSPEAIEDESEMEERVDDSDNYNE